MSHYHTLEDQTSFAISAFFPLPRPKPRSGSPFSVQYNTSTVHTYRGMERSTWHMDRDSVNHDQILLLFLFPFAIYHLPFTDNRFSS